MHPIDYLIIVLYFALVIGIGFWYKRRAARNLDSYFLGGKRLHWLALAMSGSVSNFDITGTMWIVTLIYLFGLKSMWNHWMWGFLMGAFFLAFMGKWIRRSGVMTGAEWMVTRFGDGPGGRLARLSYSLMAVVTLTAFVGYAFQGIGKFASEFVKFGLPPEQAAQVCAVGVFAITTLYVLLGGLYSVVITNVIQTVILTAAGILIAAIAYTTITPELLAEKLPDGWMSLWPRWQLSDAEQALVAGTDYAGYYLFGALVIVWVVKGLLLNVGGPGQMYDFQLFLAARDPRDAAKVGAAWSGFLIVRWAMAMGIALLAVTGLLVLEQPEPAAGADTGQVVAAAAEPPESTDPAGSVSFDAERVMPAVLKKFLWPGVRGLVIAGLLAAFMSTFSATVNAAASYIVRDLWQPLVRPGADPKQLVWASYAATLAVVLTGTVIGLSVQSIRQVFDWIMMELGAAFVIPNVLRWYWWRLNGWGYAIGTLVGLAGAIAVPILPQIPWVCEIIAGYWPKGLPLYVTFPAICTLSLIGCLAGTWLTRATDETILVSFCKNVRPFGAWGRILRKTGLKADQLAERSESMPLAAVNVVLGIVVILGAYLFPMYLVGHWHGRAMLCLAMAVAAAVVLYFTWYRSLPES